MEGREGKKEWSLKQPYSKFDEQKRMETSKPFLHLAPSPPLKPLSPQKIQIWTPKDPFLARIYTFYKRSRNGIMKKYSALSFYNVRKVKWSNPFKTWRWKKHIRLNMETFRDLYGDQRALNNCAYALAKYSPRDAFKRREKERILNSYLRELLRIRILNA